MFADINTISPMDSTRSLSELSSKELKGRELASDYLILEENT